MNTLRTISVKTQVRRLKYFSVFSNILGRKGSNIDFFRRSIDIWKNDYHSDFQNYYSSTGEINPKNSNRITQSFKNYLDAAKRLSLLNIEEGWVYPTRTSLVLKSLNIELNNQNAYILKDIEKVFFLYILSKFDADRIYCVLEMLVKKPGLTLRDYQKMFENFYLHFLEKKLIKASKSSKEIILDAITRVKNWRSAERYSEDIVPPRINWWLDLGFIDPILFKKNEIFCNKEVIDPYSFAQEFSFKKAINYLNFNNVISWSNTPSSRKNDLLLEYLLSAYNIFGVLNLPRLPLKETLLFLALKLLQKNSIVAEIKDLEEWIGFERKIKGLTVGIRRAGRTYESYLYIKNG